MHVLFVRPNAGFYVHFAAQPSLGLLALASFLQSKGHTVRIFDHELEHGLMETVAAFKPDAVAVTLFSDASIPDAMEISRALKALGLPVFWGGHMASAIPELVARSGFVDYVGISEGEYTLLELLEVAEGKRAPETVLGIAYVDKNGEYRRTADRPFADLSDFPPLDYSLVPVERFNYKLPFANRISPMMASKGCPFSCTYCFNSEYHRCQRRVYPQEVVFQQVQTLATRHGFDGFLFVDEIFGTDKQELRSFCQGIKDLHLAVTWGTETTIGMLTRADLEIMHDAGCRWLQFGLESGCAEMRKKIHKFYDASKIDETFRNCREIGIMTQGQFIIALPDETPEQVRETVRLCFRTQPDMFSLAFFVPIPGTQLCRELEAAGKLTLPKTLEDRVGSAMERQLLRQNFSFIPDKGLQVIQKCFHWWLVFRKKRRIPGVKRSSFLEIGLENLLVNLRRTGLCGLARNLWESGKLFCSVAWYAHAYPSIRKKYDLYAKNFGRTNWD